MIQKKQIIELDFIICFFRGSMTFQTIYPKEVMEKQKERNSRVLDLRSREEYISSHWPGAYSYSYENEENWGVNLNKNMIYILYCDHGGNSMQAARILGKRGIKVYTVIGGYDAMKKIQENYFKK